MTRASPHPSQASAPPIAAGDASHRYLCVELAAESYAVPLLSVHEIQAYAAPTPLPGTPPHVRGVANLHGQIVPVVDLRRRVGMPEQPYGRLTVTVFVGVGPQLAGLIVDAASRVVELDQRAIMPPPEISDGVDVSFITGITRAGDRTVIVLDVAALLRGDPALALSTVSRDSQGSQRSSQRGSP